MAHRPLTSLFVDLNAFFASVEQQRDPALRSRPVAVVPMNVDTTACIAVSYQARRFGIRTGTKVAEAKQRCPDIALVRSDHKLYIEYHHRILNAIETCAPVQDVHSIDECSIRLDPSQREPQAAARLAKQIKQAIARDAGEVLTCSIGIAPNRFLAKVASTMQKPDGLTIITHDHIPQALLNLQLRDLPGIGPANEARLNAAAVNSIQQLYALNKQQLRTIWQSLLGEVWWNQLRGLEDWYDRASDARRTIGHQHVMPPEFRNPQGTRAIATRLLHKAAARARHLGYHASELKVRIACADQPSIKAHRRFEPENDPLALQHALDRVWTSIEPRLQSASPVKTAITLLDLKRSDTLPQPLFQASANEQRLARAIDTINQRYAHDAIYLGGMHTAKKTAERRIAFRNIPSLDIPDLDAENHDDDTTRS